MKKIVHLVNTGNYSGLENVVMNICKLDKNNEHIYVSPRGKINNILKKNNVRHIDVQKISCRKISKIIKQEKPDIIHAHDVTASVIAAVLSFRFKKRIISHLHSNDPLMNVFSKRWLLYTLSIPRFEKIFIVSESVKDEYKGNFLKNSITLGNVVFFSGIEQVTTEKLYDVIMVGRLEPQKDPIKFLSIITHVKKEIPSIKAAYVGEGSMYEEFHKNINSMGLKSNINYLGFQENPYQFMKKSRVFVLTSLYEGFGLVALEAMLLGLPAVVSNVGGLPTIVDNKSGLISSNIDYQVTEIIKLLKSDSYYRNKSKHAQAKAIKLNDIDKFLSKLQTVYGN
ncbi:glycosyltransferase [Marinilactibacillus piezotolerans]|uniref:glycosyltransferase n=1 Tax=Marinilactibacillus piezotolerans TaxID=258723 RepID=UPI0009B0E708|nr:glycosyltransferase [Marinilactibacillus piezotolerans]